jgi:hypothetical protein
MVSAAPVCFVTIKKKKKKRIPIAKPPLIYIYIYIFLKHQLLRKDKQIFNLCAPTMNVAFEKSRFSSFFRFHKKTVPSKGQQRI